MVYRVEAAYSSRIFFSHRNTAVEGQSSFWLLNGRVTFGAEDDMWRASFWAKNITNERYLQDTRNANFGVIRSAGSPRYFGLEIQGQLDALPGWLSL